MSGTKEDITFRQIRTFVCAAKMGSFARASNALDISQPAVSDQVSALEKRLGYSLFRRRRGTTPVLTPQGKEALELSKKILAQSQAIYDCGSENRQEKIDLKIYISPYLRDKYLRPLLPQIHRKHPNMDLHFPALMPTPKAFEALNKGDFDLLALTIRPGFEMLHNIKTLEEVPTVMVGSPKTKEQIDTGFLTLKDLQFIFPATQEVAGDWTRTTLKSMGLTPSKPSIFCELGDVVPELLGDEGSATIMLRESVDEHLSSGMLRIIDVTTPSMNRVIACSPNAPKAASIIEEYLCNAFSAKKPKSQKPKEIAQV